MKYSIFDAENKELLKQIQEDTNLSEEDVIKIKNDLEQSMEEIIKELTQNE